MPFEEKPRFPACMDRSVVHDEDKPPEPLLPHVPEKALQMPLELPAPTPSVGIVKDLPGRP